MADSYQMTQCRLERKDSLGILHHQVAWIPTVRANNRKVRIKGEEGVWVVTDKYAIDSSENVIANSSDYRNHRKATDV